MSGIFDLVTLGTPVSNRILAWFAETVVVGSALAILAILAGRSRYLGSGPVARHAFWLVVLIKLVTPPLIDWPWSLNVPVVSTPSDPQPLAAVTTEILQPEPVTIQLIDQSIRLSDHPIEVSGPSRWSLLSFGIASIWLLGSIVRAVFQSIKLVRFSRLVALGEPAPGWLIDEANAVAAQMGVRVPPIRVVPGLATPLVWCLGRPVLLIPLELLKTLEFDRWRAILAHELAHLRRGDHWVRRLELVAGLAWWWCPLYRWVCRKLEFEAELACDAWAVWASPEHRVNYAESLIRIGASLPLVESPTPALGVVGSGRSFERRLTMILKNQVERQISMPSLFLAATLGALALPSWTLAAQAGDEPAKTTPKVEVVVGKPTIEVFVDDEGDENQAKIKKLSQKLDASLKEMEKKHKQKQQEKLDATVKEMEKKQMALQKEIEAKFGPGSDFAKKMEAMGKDLELKIGDGSDLAKKIEAMTKEIEATFGPNSEFVKELEAKFGPESEFAKEAAKLAKAKVKFETRVVTGAELEAMAKAIEKQTKNVEVKVDPGKTQKDSAAKRARRIKAIQSAIDQLQAELKALKAETPEDDDQD